jgi:hypothetical protein
METEIQTGDKDDFMNCTLQPFLTSCYIPKETFIISVYVSIGGSMQMAGLLVGRLYGEHRLSPDII